MSMAWVCGMCPLSPIFFVQLVLGFTKMAMCARGLWDSHGDWYNIMVAGGTADGKRYLNRAGDGSSLELQAYSANGTSSDDAVAQLQDGHENSGPLLWKLIKGNGDWYNIVVEKDGDNGYLYLSAKQDGSKVDLGTRDHASGRQRWMLRKGADDWYNVVVMGGVDSGWWWEDDKTFLSTNADGSKVDLWTEDDGSGRQRWVLVGEAAMPDATTTCPKDTGDTCWIFDCDGKATCESGSCVCPEGLCAKDGRCEDLVVTSVPTPAPSNYSSVRAPSAAPTSVVEHATCPKKTGGSCWFWDCDSSRGATCEDGDCVCTTGCAFNGKCVELGQTAAPAPSPTPVCERDTGGTCHIFGCGDSRHATCEDGRCVCAVGCSRAGRCVSDGCPIIHGSYEDSAHNYDVVLAQTGCDIVVMYGESFLSGSVWSTGAVHVNSFDAAGRIANDSTRIVFGDGAVWSKKRRELGKGFDGLLSSTEFAIGNLDAFSAPGGLATVWLSNVQCSLPFVGQPAQHFARRSPTLAQFSFALRDIGIMCTLDWRVQYGPTWLALDESGHAIIFGAQNSVNTTLDVVSDFNKGLPTGVRVSGCEALASIDKVQFRGGDVAATIVDVLEDVIAKFIGEEIQSMVCQEVTTSGNETLVPLIGRLSNYVGPHIPCVASRTPTKTVLNQTITMCSKEADVLKADPLSAEKGFKNLGDTPSRIIDFQSDGLFAHAIKSAADSLGEQQLDTAKNESVLGINLLTRALTDGTGTKVINLSERVTFGKVTANVTNVTVRGLDSFTRFQPLQALSNWTLGTSLEMGGLDVEVGVHISVDEDPLDDVSEIDTSKFQNLTMQLSLASGLRDINLSSAALSAFDLDDLMRTQLGALLKDLVPCLLKPFVAINFTRLAMSASNWSVPTIAGIPDIELQDLLNNLTVGMHDIYRWPVLDALPSVSSTVARPWINERLSAGMQNAGSKCKPVPPDSGVPQYMNFQKDPLFRAARNLLDSYSRPDQSELGINKAVIGPLTRDMNPRGIPGAIQLNESFGFQFDVRFLKGDEVDETVPPVSAVNVEGQSLLISGLNTVFDLDLLQPTPLSQADRPHSLHSEVGIGRGAAGDAEPLKLTMNSVQIDFLRPSAKHHNNVDLRLEVRDARVATDMQVLLDWTRLERLQIGQLFSVDCLVSTLGQHGLQLQNANITVGSLNLSLGCKSCETAGLLELEGTLRQPQSPEQLTDVVNGALNFASALLEGSSFRRWIDDRILASRDACLQWNETASGQVYNGTDEGEVPIPPPPISFAAFIFLLAGFLLAATGVAWVTYRCTQRSRVRDLKKEQFRRASALVEHDAVPRAVRIGVVVALLASVALYLQGHLMRAGLIRLSLHVAGEDLLEDNFEEFRFGKAMVDLYNARAYLVAIVLLLFSGLWPYVKTGIVMYAWCARPKLEDLERRGRVIRWLDKFGKLSMIDVFVLVFCLIAFRLHLVTPSRWTFLPSAFFGADVQVEICWGFYANMLAQVVSQIACHLVLYFHQVAIASDEQVEKRGSTDQKADKSCTSTSGQSDSFTFRESQFSPAVDAKQQTNANQDHRASVASFALRGPGVGLNIARLLLQVGVPAALCFVCVLVVWGTIVPAFRVDVAGLVGAFMDFAEPGSRSTGYSVLDVVWAISSEKRPSVASYVGIHYLLLIFILCTVIMPVALAAALIAMWLVPLSLPSRAKYLFVLETMASWQYLLVYLLAILVAVLQLTTISESMIQACTHIDGVLADLGRSGLLQPGDDRCLSLKASPELGFYLLGAGGLLLVLVRRIIFKVAAAADVASDALSTDCSVAAVQDKLPSTVGNSADGRFAGDTKSMRDEEAPATPAKPSVGPGSEEALANAVAPSSIGEAPAARRVKDEEAPSTPAGVEPALGHVTRT